MVFLATSNLILKYLALCHKFIINLFLLKIVFLLVHLQMILWNPQFHLVSQVLHHLEIYQYLFFDFLRMAHPVFRMEASINWLHFLQLTYFLSALAAYRKFLYFFILIIQFSHYTLSIMNSTWVKIIKLSEFLDSLM